MNEMTPKDIYDDMRTELALTAIGHPNADVREVARYNLEAMDDDYPFAVSGCGWVGGQLRYTKG